jgi:hypothetical protein
MKEIHKPKSKFNTGKKYVINLHSLLYFSWLLFLIINISFINSNKLVFLPRILFQSFWIMFSNLYFCYSF